jgi:hypothetical protein
LIIVVNIKRKRKKTKRQSRRRERNEASAVLFKEVNVLVELDANFLTMNR